VFLLNSFSIRLLSGQRVHLNTGALPLFAREEHSVTGSFERAGSLPKIGRPEPGIDFEGDRLAGVPEELRDLGHRHTTLRHVHRCGVAQCVRRNHGR
jgi:hypothetical protein